MANIYDMNTAIQQPNVVGNFDQGVQTAQANQIFQQKQDAYNTALGNQQNISQLAPQVIAGDPTATAQMAAIDPQQAQNYQQAGNAQLTRLSGAMNYLDQQTTPEAKEAAYQSAVKPYLDSLGQATGKVAPASFADAEPLMEAARAQIASISSASAPIKVGAGESLVDPNTYKALFTAPTANAGKANIIQVQRGQDANGNPIYTQYYDNGPGKPLTPLMAPDGSTSAQGASGTTNALAGLAGAVQTVESGNNPNAVSSAGAQGLMQLMPSTAANPGFGIQPAQDGSPQENQRVGQQYLQAMLDRYKNGPMALAAYNAGPGSVDAALQQANGDPNRAMMMLPAETQAYVPKVLATLQANQGNPSGAQTSPTAPNGGDAGGIGTSVGMGGGTVPTSSTTSPPAAAATLPFGSYVKPAPAADQNVIQKREAEVQELIKQGVPVNAQQHQTYLSTGKLAEDADIPLSAGDEAEAQALASYKLPISPYALSKPTMTPLVQRALQINPNFNAMQYATNQKMLGGLASTTPNSMGGTVMAAGAALGHLNDMADLSANLPNHPQAINTLENAVTSTANIGDASTLKDWNTAKGFLAGEAAKMVKGGVASEPEVEGMLNSLNPNDPNRNEALATFAKFMNDKLTALQGQRDDVLGPASPGTSLLNKQQQQQAQRVIGLSKNYPVPDFGAAGGIGQMNSASGQPAVQNAPVSQGGNYAHLWGG